ncbi:hypothetical protein [Ferdinandcohnia sp. SAFN-114]|uniref:hypothetical protein n=1 Tax=Ferdinandcohnia sp. SAFN-114 TaxID=3387275 RepID=UPI003F809200
MSKQQQLFDRINKNKKKTAADTMLESMKQKDSNSSTDDDNNMDIASNKNINITNDNNMDKSITFNNNIDSDVEVKTSSVNDTRNNSTMDSTLNMANLDALDALFKDNQPKSVTHTYRGFYLENDIVKVLDRLAKKGGKGIKSQLVNEALKRIFIEKGWMK